MRMPSYEFARECNIARNRELEAKLGLNTGLSRSIFGDKENSTTQNKSAKSTGCRASSDSIRRSRRLVNEENRNQTAQCAEEPPAEARTTPANLVLSPRLRTPPVELSNPSQAVAVPKPISSINRTAWPRWLAEKYDHYAGLEFGNVWKEGLRVWAELERAFDFHSPVC